MGPSRVKHEPTPAINHHRWGRYQRSLRKRRRHAGQRTAEPKRSAFAAPRVHNLQNVDVDIPRDRLVVITGPSGSGKSSLAFDTLYAEGQRQYIESLSVYARQFLHQMERPDVDLIEGLQPTISVDQRAGSQNPRSTVATVTEIYDYLRLLMARLGKPHCYQCGAPIRQQSPEQIVEDLLATAGRHQGDDPGPAGPRPQRAAQGSVCRDPQGGFVRARVDGEVIDVEHVARAGPAQESHDRGGGRPGGDSRRPRIAAGRIGRAGDPAWRRSGGRWSHAAAARRAEQPAGRPGDEELFSTLYACPNCKLSFEELEPRTFSFNSPYGACPECEGLGCHVSSIPNW